MEAIMDQLQAFFQLLAKMHWSDVFDIILVAYLIYRLLPLMRSTSMARIVRVVVVILLLASVTEALKLYTLHFIVNQFLAVGIIALVILYQPELRRMLDQITNVKFANLIGPPKTQQEMDAVISQTVMACETMSRQRVGALIVFARRQPLDEYFKTGTQIDGMVSEQLIRNIFFTNASLHDGAMIVRNGRIAAAGCVLPLSESDRLSADLGTRHRAGVGMSEASDAVVVIVSEETGTISVAVGGMLKRHLAPQTLERLLHNELCPEPSETENSPMARLQKKLQRKEKGGDKQ